MKYYINYWHGKFKFNSNKEILQETLPDGREFDYIYFDTLDEVKDWVENSKVIKLVSFQFFPDDSNAIAITQYNSWSPR
jgi:hypothetical protein